MINKWKRRLHQSLISNANRVFIVSLSCLIFGIFAVLVLMEGIK